MKGLLEPLVEVLGRNDLVVIVVGCRHFALRCALTAEPFERAAGDDKLAASSGRKIRDNADCELGVGFECFDEILDFIVGVDGRRR